jgi:enoyl-CoA hydratase/carnithine racemase
LLLSRLKRSFVFDLIQGGEIIGTQRALEINLIDASYGDEDLQNKAIEWAQKIPSNFAFECNKKWMNQKLFERVKLSLLASANFDQT